MTVAVDAVVYYRVSNPTICVSNVENFRYEPIRKIHALCTVPPRPPYYRLNINTLQPLHAIVSSKKAKKLCVCVFEM